MLVAGEARHVGTGLTDGGTGCDYIDSVDAREWDSLRILSHFWCLHSWLGLQGERRKPANKSGTSESAGEPALESASNHCLGTLEY